MFAVHASSTKTTNIYTLEIYPLYGTSIWVQKLAVEHALKNKDTLIIEQAPIIYGRSDRPWNILTGYLPNHSLKGLSLTPMAYLSKQQAVKIPSLRLNYLSSMNLWRRWYTRYPDPCHLESCLKPLKQYHNPWSISEILQSLPLLWTTRWTHTHAQNQRWLAINIHGIYTDGSVSALPWLNVVGLDFLYLVIRTIVDVHTVSIIDHFLKPCMWLSVSKIFLYYLWYNLGAPFFALLSLTFITLSYFTMIN